MHFRGYGKVKRPVSLDLFRFKEIVNWIQKPDLLKRPLKT